MRMNTQATAREYFAAVPAKPRAALVKIRQAIQAAAPDAKLGMSYGMPTFRYRGRMLVCFAAFKNHCSFFPASYAVMTAHQKDLGRFEVSKGTIRFTPEKPLPVTLVKKMVRQRVKEQQARWPEERARTP